MDEIRGLHHEAFLTVHVNRGWVALDDTNAVSHRIQQIRDGLLVSLLFGIAWHRSEANSFQKSWLPTGRDVCTTLQEGNSAMCMNIIRVPAKHLKLCSLTWVLVLALDSSVVISVKSDSRGIITVGWWFALTAEELEEAEEHECGQDYDGRLKKAKRRWKSGRRRSQIRGVNVMHVWWAARISRKSGDAKKWGRERSKLVWTMPNRWQWNGPICLIWE